MGSSAPPGPTLRVITSLRLGERVVVRSDGGVLAAEYMIFDLGDIVLRATDPVTVREAGYLTTAQTALERLSGAGVTAELANDAAQALLPAATASFARGRATRSIAGRLSAHEL